MKLFHAISTYAIHLHTTIEREYFIFLTKSEIIDVFPMLEFCPWGIAVILSVVLLADTWKGKLYCVHRHSSSYVSSLHLQVFTLTEDVWRWSYPLRPNSAQWIDETGAMLLCESWIGWDFNKRGKCQHLWGSIAHKYHGAPTEHMLLSSLLCSLPIIVS